MTFKEFLIFRGKRKKMNFFQHYDSTHITFKSLMSRVCRILHKEEKTAHIVSLHVFFTVFWQFALKKCSKR